MGFLDRLRGKDDTTPAERVGERVASHDEPIEDAIDRVADLADRATEGRHPARMEETAASLKDAAERGGDGPRP